MAEIGNLTIKVDADTSALQRKLRSAKADYKALERVRYDVWRVRLTWGTIGLVAGVIIATVI